MAHDNFGGLRVWVFISKHMNQNAFYKDIHFIRNIMELFDLHFIRVHHGAF